MPSHLLLSSLCVEGNLLKWVRALADDLRLPNYIPLNFTYILLPPQHPFFMSIPHHNIYKLHSLRIFGAAIGQWKRGEGVLATFIDEV